MDFTFTEEQQAIAELSAQIIGDRSAPDTLRTLERSGELRIDRTLWSNLAEAGLLALGLPESVGGAGLGLVEVGCVLTAAGRFAAAVPLWETLGLTAPALLASQSDAAAVALTKLAAGELMGTAAWHHDGSFEPLSPAITAEGSTLSGVAVCVPSALVADVIVVPARVGDGVGVFLVDVTSAGVEIVAVETTAGTPEGNLVLTNAPAELLGEGAELLQSLFDQATATQCSLALGNCEAALALTAEYTKERKQFGVPIASFQAVGHRAADAYIDTQSIRLTSMQALWRLANGMPATDEVAIAKFWAAFGAQRVVHAAGHLHGGVGVDRDYPLPRHFLMAKQIELQLGGASASLRRLGASIAASAG
jgi:alkylation response protein AidB-like acyl-CoA dehydrogenase